MPVDWFFQPSSTWPLQLSSRPLQTSVVPAPAMTEQVVLVCAALHTRLPVRWHAPMPTVHELPSVGKPLSIVPSQSSSMPLHFSVIGEPAVTEHCVALPSAVHRVT